MIHTRTHSLLWMHACTPYPHGAPPRDCVEELIRPVLRLRKSLHAPHCRRKRRLPLQNIPPLWNTKISNLGFKLCWTGGVTIILTIQLQVGSQPYIIKCVVTILLSNCLTDTSVVEVPSRLVVGMKNTDLIFSLRSGPSTHKHVQVRELVLTLQTRNVVLRKKKKDSERCPGSPVAGRRSKSRVDSTASYCTWAWS
jgi:hypothetical protein